MKRLLISLLMIATLGSPTLAASIQGDCNISFIGTSTLHDFSGTGRCLPFSVEIGDDGMVAPIDLHVPITSMQTGNDSRDEKMRDMFETESFPEVVGHFRGGRLAELRASLNEASVAGTTIPLNLTIRDVEVPVEATITQLIDNERTFSFDLSYSLSLATCQLEAPSVLGLIRVGDEVKVRNRLHLRPLPQN